MIFDYITFSKEIPQFKTGLKYLTEPGTSQATYKADGGGSKSKKRKRDDAAVAEAGASGSDVEDEKDAETDEVATATADTGPEMIEFTNSLGYMKRISITPQVMRI